MTSSNSKLRIISSEMNSLSLEMNSLSLKMNTLLQRKKMLCLHQDLRSQLHFGYRDNDLYQQEVEQIDEKLKQLSATKAELKKTFENLDTKDMEEEEVNAELSEEIDAGMNVFNVESPNNPAPIVVLDMKNFPRCPCRTQCPECRQAITTETISSVSDVSWLLCYSAASIGCVAGCCLIPFCVDRFKSITHKCPMCGTSIGTVRRF